MTMVAPNKSKAAYRDSLGLYINAKTKWFESLEELERLPGFRNEGLKPVVDRFALRINSYYLDLIREAGDPLGRQVIPDRRELDDPVFDLDPLNEEGQSPVPSLVHRYPDRVLLLVSDSCAVHCRFCMRRRKVAAGQPDLEPAFAYIAERRKVREVILSGGDPLMLSDARLEIILSRLRQIKHVELIRIHSRVPSAWPSRITPELARMLASFHPLFLVAHFNHPREITSFSARACGLLADAGIPLGCQSVLLAGVNDDYQTQVDLLTSLLRIRVRPYYLHQLDPISGTAHFRVPLAQALDLMSRLRGNLTGLAIPQLMIDLPGGGGKVPLVPEYVVSRKPGLWKIRNFKGQVFDYPWV